MKKSSWAMLLAACALALTSTNLEAQTHHHKKMHGKHMHHKYHGHHLVRHARAGGHSYAAVQVHVSLGAQSLSLDVNGSHYATWPVSTARAGYVTPQGTYHAIRMARVYYSKKYDNSPMPNSVFFHGGYAIHGTYHVSGLGHRASHGCVRLAPGNAAQLYSLVQEYGMGSTRIVITN